MKSTKCTIIWVASIVCFVWFIISFLKLILGSAADASQNYGVGLSLIAGIVVAVVDVIEIFRQKKNSDKGFIAFIISSFKKENGKDMSRLVWALFFSLSPLFILIAVLIILSGSGNAAAKAGNAAANAGSSNSANNNNTNSNQGVNKAAGGSNSAKENKTNSNQEINRVAANPNNNVKPVSDLVDKNVKEFSRINAGLSPEEQFEKFKKERPGTGINFETFVAHSDTGEHSNEEINKIAMRSDNKVNTVSDSVDKTIKEFCKLNVGLSDEEKYEKFKKERIGISVNQETFRAHSAIGSLSNEELTKIANRPDNKMKPVSDLIHKAILEFKKNNPGLTTEQQYEKFKKENPARAVNLETFRAHNN